MELIDVITCGNTYKAFSKPLAVKEWFAAKTFKEKGKTRFFDNHILAIFGETEKAYNCLLGGLATSCFTWVPKSVVIEESAEENNETYFVKNFEEAKELLQDIRNWWH